MFYTRAMEKINKWDVSSEAKPEVPENDLFPENLSDKDVEVWLHESISDLREVPSCNRSASPPREDFIRPHGFDLAPYQSSDSWYRKKSREPSPSTEAVLDNMKEEEDKYEVSEMLQYPNDDWTIAVPINFAQSKDETVTEMVLYSYDKGIQRIDLLSDQITKDIKTTNLLKYKENKRRTGYEVKPLYSAMPSTQLMTLKVRYNKGIELKIYGLANFVDFEKDAEAHMIDTILWTDAVGVIRITPAERSAIWRKQIHSESEIFAPLRLCNIVIKADFTLSSPNGFHPKWVISSAHPILEESENDRSTQIGRGLWPARVVRFDDLVFVYQASEGYHFKSVSQPNIKVFACNHLRDCIESAGHDYEKGKIFSAVVYPRNHSSSRNYYEALVIGPLKMLACLTENRILNYCPKTWSPELQHRLQREEREKSKKFEEKVKSSPHYLSDIKAVNEYKFGMRPTPFGSFEA